MIQILYTEDHKARGTTLAAEQGDAPHGLIDIEAITKEGLDTLVLWGHGDALRFCGKNVDDMKDIIKAWKKKNGGLKTVELITCNVRHYSTLMSSESYLKKLKSALSGFFSSTGGLKLKALPVTCTGSEDAFSILLAETNHKSWCYVTGPGTDDTVMMKGASLIKFETVDGKTKSYTGDIAERANEMVKITDRKWTMNYGYFNSLRGCLVEFK